jgi:hypothetical protein
MLAERFVTRTDQQGRLLGLPTFPANEEVEVIVLRQEKPAAPAQQALEQAYREAATEIDKDWEATDKDGLSDETW